MNPDNVNVGNAGAVEELDDTDKQWLHDVVRRHAEETASTVAEKLLAEWTVSVDRFSKIIPSAYKAVLAAKEAAYPFHVKLRVDANGGWTVPEAIEMMKWLADHGVDYVGSGYAQSIHKPALDAALG